MEKCKITKFERPEPLSHDTAYPSNLGHLGQAVFEVHGKSIYVGSSDDSAYNWEMSLDAFSDDERKVIQKLARQVKCKSKLAWREVDTTVTKWQKKVGIITSGKR